VATLTDPSSRLGQYASSIARAAESTTQVRASSEAFRNRISISSSADSVARRTWRVSTGGTGRSRRLPVGGSFASSTRGSPAVWASGGHESWHPNPDLYYEAGGGPLFDMGPYYVTALVSLLGPASRVTGSVTQTHAERTITSEPRHGETIDVEVPTHESGVIDFASGATATVTTSFDAPGCTTLGSPAFELYGTEGTLSLPNPNNFDGAVHVHGPDGDAREVAHTHEYTGGRGAGVADLARAIRSDWNHRTSGDLAYHVLEILDGVRTASDTGEHVSLETTVDRPEPLPEDFPAGSGSPSRQ
jgi:hypothetical protein